MCSWKESNKRARRREVSKEQCVLRNGLILIRGGREREGMGIHDRKLVSLLSVITVNQY